MNPLNLSEFHQPKANNSTTVESALGAIRIAVDQSTAYEAYEKFLWSVGNNHAGTFYPVVLGTLPEIEQILLSGSEWAKYAAIEALLDLGGSFTPEEGCENPWCPGSRNAQCIHLFDAQ